MMPAPARAQPGSRPDITASMQHACALLPTCTARWMRLPPLNSGTKRARCTSPDGIASGSSLQGRRVRACRRGRTVPARTSPLCLCTIQLQARPPRGKIVLASTVRSANCGTKQPCTRCCLLGL